MEYNAQYLTAIRPYLKEGALITDVGSTKTSIHEEIARRAWRTASWGATPWQARKRRAMKIPLTICWKTPTTS